MHDDGLDAARALLPGARLDTVVELTRSERSDVRRVRVRTADRDETVIVKQFVTAGEGWVRETSALGVLPEHAPAPRLVLAGAEPPVAILTDLGEGPSLADALLGRDRADATEALGRWAEALAALHTGSAGLREPFGAALAARAGDLPVAETPIAVALHDAVRSVEARAADLGIATSHAALEQLRELAHRLGADGPAALSPDDTCPDNNVRTADGRLVLIDFEGAEWRSAAWDLAYLRVPWPTCWCSWRLPDAAADAALQRYRTAAGAPFDRIPDADIDAAGLAWAFISLHLFAARALADDPPAPQGPFRPRPTRRAMILHRLAGAANNEELPAAADLAGRLHAELVRRWGAVELAYAPAFRD